MSEPLTQLSAALRRLNEIPALVQRIKNIPDDYAGFVDRVHFSRFNETRERDLVVARNAIASARESERHRGEIERDERLLALSHEIDAIRAILPQLAARAAIDLGAVARQMRSGLE